MDKWARFYASAESPPPWCSGRPSTHLERFLRTGSVRAGAVDAEGAPTPPRAPPSPSPPPPPPPTPRGYALDVGCGSNGTNVALLASHGGYRAAAGIDLVPEAVVRARRGAAAWLSAAARAEGPPPPPPPPPPAPIAFAAVDVMTAYPTRLSSWDDVRRMEEEQLGGGGGGGGAETSGRGARAAAAQPPGPPFSLLFDCQTYHVLRTVVDDEQAVVARYRSLLEPGGVLVLLCGRPADDADAVARSDGPNEVALGELRQAFSPASGWREREVVATRFDPTAAYDRLKGGPPLAWAAVFEAV